MNHNLLKKTMNPKLNECSCLVLNLVINNSFHTIEKKDK